jgi:hypothetical protein
MSGRRQRSQNRRHGNASSCKGSQTWESRLVSLHARPSPCWGTHSGLQGILAQAGRGVKSHITAQGGLCACRCAHLPHCFRPSRHAGDLSRRPAPQEGSRRAPQTERSPAGRFHQRPLYMRAWDCGQSGRATGWPPKATGSTGVGSQQRQQTSRHGRRCPAVGPGPCRRSLPLEWATARQKPGSRQPG